MQCPKRAAFGQVAAAVLASFALAFCMTLTLVTPAMAARRDDNIIAAPSFTSSFNNMWTLSVNPGYSAAELAWSSSDEEVAKAFPGGKVIFEAVGTCTITATAPDGTYDTCEVTVTSQGTYNSMFGLGLNTTSATLFPGEELQLATGGVSKATWTTSSASVATVSNRGLVKAASCGTTTITCTDPDGNTGSCKVTVVEDKGQFIPAIADKSYTVRTSPLCIECDRFYLLIAAGTTLDESIVPKLEQVMDAIEAATGYSFYPQGTRYESEKFLVVLDRANYIFAGANQDRAYFDASLADPDGDYSALVHELLHTVQMRNTGSAGVVFTEGFAGSYTMEVMEALWGTHCYDELYNRVADLSQFPELNAENILDNLCDPADSHTLSYFFVEWLRSVAGEDALKDMLSQIESQGLGIYYAESGSVEAAKTVLELLEAKLGLTESKLAEAFYKFFSQLKESSPDALRSDVQVFQPFWSNLNWEWVYDGWELLSEESVTVDYSMLISQAQQSMGKKAFGLAVNLLVEDGTGTYSFYDDSGTLIKSVPAAADSYVYKVPGAVSVTFTGKGKFSCWLDSAITFSAEGAQEDIPALEKRKNPMTVKAAKTTLKANKSKAQTVKLTVKGAKGRVTYSSNKAKVTVKNSVVTVAKSFKGTVTITVKATGTETYKAKTVKVKITVK